MSEIQNMSETQNTLETPELRELIFEQVKNLYEKGYAYFDLIELGYFTEEEILDIQTTCLNSYYKYFTDRGIKREDVEIDLSKKMETNKYFKQPKDSPMFKAMYGDISKAGNEYINCRNPANAMNCGMGRATSQKEIYYNEQLNEYTERLRPLYNALYRHPVKRHLARFGLKLPHKKSKDMVAHTDMSYCEEVKENGAILKDADDPTARAPYSKKGINMRIQSVLGLSNSESGWYGYPGSHKKYNEIGEAIKWPGLKRTPQQIPIEVLEKLGLERVDIPTKIGRLIIWNCVIVHGNSPCKDRPRLVKYINFQPDLKNTTADRIIGLGNQPNEEKSKQIKKISKSAQIAINAHLNKTICYKKK
jgi:hypothetical protein